MTLPTKKGPRSSTRSTSASWLSVLLIGMFATACGGAQVDEPAEEPAATEQAEAESAATDPPEAAEPALLRGTVIHDEGIATLRPCGSDETLAIADDAGRVAELHTELATGLAPGAGLFTVIEGFRTDAPPQGTGADADGSLQVDSVLYFGFEGPDCESAWNFRYRARGNEPFWMVQVDDNELRLTRPAEDDLMWPAFETIERDEGPTYRAPETGELPEAILTLRAGGCHDSMSGAYFGYSATFEFGEESFSGCALAGGR